MTGGHRPGFERAWVVKEERGAMSEIECGWRRSEVAYKQTRQRFDITTTAQRINATRKKWEKKKKRSRDEMRGKKTGGIHGDLEGAWGENI
jgi:hypothetical protein